MLIQRGEDKAHLLQMLRLGADVDKDIAEEDQDEAVEARLEYVIH
jgi:hypothetical protein